MSRSSSFCQAYPLKRTDHWLLPFTSWTRDFEVQHRQHLHHLRTAATCRGTTHSELNRTKCLCSWNHEATCNHGAIWMIWKWVSARFLFTLGRTRDDKSCQAENFTRWHACISCIFMYIHLGGKIGLPSGCGNSSLNVQYDTILTYPPGRRWILFHSNRFC